MVYPQASTQYNELEAQICSVSADENYIDGGKHLCVGRMGTHLDKAVLSDCSYLNEHRIT